MEQGTTAKLCECGCGQPAPISPGNDNQGGWLKGQPKKFIRGHNIKNDRAPWFKGDAAGVGALHTYVRKYFPKSGVCEECGKRTSRTEYALIKGRQYSRDRSDYRELCKLCHNRYDEISDKRWRGVVTARQVAGEAPSCRCGCGDQVTWDYSHRRWFAYKSGHRQPAASSAQRAPRMRLAITCEHCGNQFKGRVDAQFCSKACKAAQRRASGVDDVERTCHQCGGSFTANRYAKSRHCSRSCGTKCRHAGDCPC